MAATSVNERKCKTDRTDPAQKQAGQKTFEKK